jgi:tetratricopeptide (TPR) repeat protein
MRHHDYQTQARAHILARNWSQVLELGRAWNQADPNDPIARLLLVTGLLLKGDYREAYVQHDRLFRLPDEDERDTAAQQDPRAALRAFADQLAEEHPDNSGARLFLGLTLAQIGDLEGAIREYKESARLAPDDPFPRYFHGQALHMLDRLDMAIREYREAVTLAPQDVRMRLNLGSVYYEQGILESAIAQYREALKLHPDDPYIHYNLGLALADQGRFELAIAAYKESARLNPKDPLVRYRGDQRV